jgi:hypothetical protein
MICAWSRVVKSESEGLGVSIFCFMKCLSYIYTIDAFKMPDIISRLNVYKTTKFKMLNYFFKFYFAAARNRSAASASPYKAKANLMANKEMVNYLMLHHNFFFQCRRESRTSISNHEIWRMFHE